MTADPHVTVCQDAAAVAKLAAGRVFDAADRAVKARGRFTLVLAGGSTPRALYALLATDWRDALPWHATTILFGDERCVPPDHADSNYGSSSRALLALVPIDPARVHRIRGELGAPAAAAEYDRIVRRVLEADPQRLFDLVLLGVGTDGHTASLFPGRDFATDRGVRAATAQAPPSSPVRDRVTLTLDALSASRCVLFLVAGSDKRAVLGRVLKAAAAGGDPSMPASMVESAGRVEWLVDRPARGA